MRVPLRAKSIRNTVSAAFQHQAPTGGWNARDALAAMKPSEAVVLDNWFPRTSYVEVRGGYAAHATGMTGTGKTLMTHNSLAGVRKMFAATEQGVYEVSSAGAVGASVAARTNGKHQWTMFGDGTNNWLIAANGTDKPLYYDGTTWTAVDGASSPALTGVTTTDIISVFLFKGRLFFILKDSLSFWYLAAGAAGGALTEFDLSGECKRGGFLMAGASWTVDAGDGPDDRAVFVTSEGEVLVYVGNNPSSATTWAKVGSYDIGRPLGRRCVEKFGGDILVLTENGLFPLSVAIQANTIDFKYAVSNKIENAFNEQARTTGTIFGWRTIDFPAQSALIVNAPVTEDGTHYQFVMNTITKAWCRFIAWDVEDFAVYNGELYATTGSVVNKMWTGAVDGVDNIEAYGKTAFSYFGNKTLQKQMKMFRPILNVNGSISFLTDIDVDFKDTPITGTATYAVVSGALWDVAEWDEAYWAAGLEIVRVWTSPDEYLGYCASGKIKVATNSLTIQWLASDYIYEMGGPLG